MRFIYQGPMKYTMVRLTMKSLHGKVLRLSSKNEKLQGKQTLNHVYDLIRNNKMQKTASTQVTKLIPCSTQLIMVFVLPINIKIAILGI